MLNRRITCPRAAGAIVVVGFVLLIPYQPLLADRIILRNLDVISDQQVVSFNADGVRLADDRVITFDLIESGRVSAAQQADFDQILKQLGSHLYRIRRRLETGDYAGLLQHAEAIYPTYAERTSATAYMVFQALMWGRLAAGQREAALEPYLRCHEYLRVSNKTGDSIALPGRRRLRVDMQTGLSSELPPLWFDVQQARQQLQPVARVISQMQKPRPPGARVYYATLALTAGRIELARSVLTDLNGLDALKNIIAAQADFLADKPALAIQQLEPLGKQLPLSQQTLALYWRGRARSVSSEPDNQRLGLLDLLRIPAAYGERFPDVAGAALYEVMQSLARQGDIAGSIAVRRELMDRYGQTWHAALLRKETGLKKETP